MDIRICLDCESRLLGRTDKKFCSDACRNNFNNRLNSDSTAQMRNIHNILRKNRRILHDLVPEESGKASITTKKLTTIGFNFDYMTHFLTTKTGNTYYFCFEYGYRKLDDQYCLLVKK